MTRPEDWQEIEPYDPGDEYGIDRAEDDYLNHMIGE